MNKHVSLFPVVLSIAGSDNTGGAGIQADIKTCIAERVYPCTVITAVTAQNNKGLKKISYVGDEMLRQQLITVYECLKPDAVKIGLLPNSSSVRIITDILNQYNQKNIVVDTVLGATAGGKFTKSAEIEDEMLSLLKSLLFPISKLITPNIPELERLLNLKNQIGDIEKKIDIFFSKFNLKNILVKGGHSSDIYSTDILYSKEGKIAEFKNERILSDHTHGTGCVLSSSIACGLAKGLSLENAIRSAKNLITKAIIRGRDFPVMELYGPVHP